MNERYILTENDSFLDSQTTMNSEAKHSGGKEKSELWWQMSAESNKRPLWTMVNF